MHFDVNEMRKPFIEYEKLECVDDEFTFYYDESNNIRKLHLTSKGLNVEKSCNFVLAGIVHRGECHSADFELLKKSLRLQKSAKEIKLKHIGKGSFECILKSEKLNTLLQWLLDNGFYIHYFSLNVLYWSIVDIVDSVIENLNHVERQFFIQAHMLVKSDLYKVIVSNESLFLEKLRDFEYPNIKSDRVGEFANFLVSFVKENSEALSEGRKYLLNKFMEGAEGSTELFFIMNEKDHILISDFFIYYLRNTYLFKNSKHFFDEEKEIEAIFNKYDLVDKGVIINNYSFVNSEEMLEVQVSDVLAGLLGKYSTFLSDTGKDKIKIIKNNLRQQQLSNLNLLEKLIDKSDAVSRGFFYRCVSEDEYLKNNYFMHDQSCI
ncbi:hypothetical protein A11A3_07910 [Alcanivorax hongdengensis A-11-3]|uniref:DUF3800 domain-containing protein n=1 Tax=Alcanivorax hongdengensis A-11-3 TaxID=1177179 RepID=L0WFE7_9GAMM|nr:DUF3800 domain-containing protein [Alcanivorax hongdengensis]EKF74535.1 hypothetical protein A11A3_07910 [Alcanivorax hongdengensis A-11-3]